MKLTLLLLLFICTVISVEVQTDKGVVVGYLENGVRIHKGIPYAAPPVGNLRWKAPQVNISLTSEKTTKVTLPCRNT